MLVVVYHFFPAILPGGYVGVDVFFVISGYLITLTLANGLVEVQGGSSVLREFWARRLRRLMPNALLVLATAGVAGVLLLSEFSLKRLGSDIFWSAIYSTNWLFVLRSIDYLVWDEAQKSPLLHFWSLAVEEQYYLLWPLFLVALRRTRLWRWRAHVVSIAFAAGLLYCVVLASRNQTAAFFSTPARAWELTAGAWLALESRWLAGLRQSSIIALSGLVAIGASALIFSDDTPHPGLVTFLPVAGAALVIAAQTDPGRSLGRLLNWRPLQVVGARSYSIYLWHWPVLVFGSVLIPHRGPGAQLALLAGALLAAEAAYRLVERPARFRWAQDWSGRRVATVACSAGLLLAAGGLTLRALGASDLRELAGLRPAAVATGLPPLQQVRADLPEIYRNGCHLSLEAVQSPPCLSGEPDAAATVVLFGDSHAAQWFSALDAATRREKLKLHSWTKSSCPSVQVPAWNPVAKSAYIQCNEWRDSTLERIVELKPRWVVLSNLVEPSPVLADASGARPLRGRAATHAWMSGLEAVIRRLQGAGIGVVLIRDVPKPRPDILDCLYAAPDPAHCALSKAEATAVSPLDVMVAKRLKVTVWDFVDDVCSGDTCPVLRDSGVVVYRDSNHLTDTEVRRLVPAVSERLRQTLVQGGELR